MEIKFLIGCVIVSFFVWLFWNAEDEDNNDHRDKNTA